MKRDLHCMLDDARQAGWSVKLTRGGQWRLTYPSGATLITGSTPSDHRGLLNLRASIRRAVPEAKPRQDAQNPRRRPKRQSRCQETLTEPLAWRGEPVNGLRVDYRPDRSRTWSF